MPPPKALLKSKRKGKLWQAPPKEKVGPADGEGGEIDEEIVPEPGDAETHSPRPRQEKKFDDLLPPQEVEEDMAFAPNVPSPIARKKRAVDGPTAEPIVDLVGRVKLERTPRRVAPDSEVVDSEVDDMVDPVTDDARKTVEGDVGDQAGLAARVRKKVSDPVPRASRGRGIRMGRGGATRGG
eukprot:Rmarinus@m.5497